MQVSLKHYPKFLTQQTNNEIIEIDEVLFFTDLKLRTWDTEKYSDLQNVTQH